MRPSRSRGPLLHAGAFCLALALALTLGLAPPGVAWGAEAAATDTSGSSLSGLPVVRVETKILGGRFEDTRATPALRVGAPFSPAAARAAARALAEGRLVSSVEVRADREGDGVVVQFLLLPRRELAGVTVLGAADASRDLEAELVMELRLARGEEVTGPSLDAIPGRARAFYAARGFPDAEVSLTLRDTDDEGAVVAVLRVRGGEPHVLRDAVVDVAHERPGLTLDAALERDVRALVEPYLPRKGTRVDEVSLAAADHELAERLRARGYHRAHVVTRAVAPRGVATALVRVTPGPRFVSRYEGMRELDADGLDAVLDLEHEPDRSVAHLATKLRAAYEARGFLDVEVLAEERGGDADPTHVLAFEIREHARVLAAPPIITCLTKGDVTTRDIERLLDATLDDAVLGLGGIGAPDGVYVRGRAIYDRDKWARAAKATEDSLRADGYLHALVGPPMPTRRTCDPRSPAGVCVPMPFVSTPRPTCPVDREGLPAEEPALPPAASCTPDPARGVSCEPVVQVLIPVRPGPRTLLYDLEFDGVEVQALPPRALASLAELELGSPVSHARLEAAAQRLRTALGELGYAFADVHADLELSKDHSRARARFTLAPGERVVVDSIVVEPPGRSDEKLLRDRVALTVCARGRPDAECEPFRPSDARTSEERIAGLGTYATVSVALEAPQLPAARKRVIVRAEKRPPQYLEVKPGFSTGEGVRMTFEYGHRDVADRAIALTLRVALGYLPDALILDGAVRANYDRLPVAKRLERRNTVSLSFPEIGLGPLVRFGIDAVDVRDNARDFGLSKEALATQLIYRPSRRFSVTLGPSFERNDIAIFNGDTVLAYVQRPGVTADIRRLLRVPDGETVVVAQRATVTWDRRDNAFTPTRGVLLAGTVEHAHAYPTDANVTTVTSDFLRATGTVSAYQRFGASGVVLAATVRGGRIVQLLDTSKTYPDRLFFLGGVDTMRGFLQDSMVPEDTAAALLDPSNVAKPDTDASKLSIDRVAIRGGDVYVNPRVELRVPIAGPVDTGLFLDTGNVWVIPGAFDPLRLRYAAGSGLRLATPIGPIALDYGVNLDRRPWEDFGAFHFAIGLF